MKNLSLLFIIVLVGSLNSFGQEFDIILTSAESGPQTHQARNSITFGPEYSYTPNGSIMTAQIVNPVVSENTDYQTFVDPENRSLNTSYKVGTTKGVFSTNSLGEATYSIPLDLPPGVAGLMPALSLTYNSFSGAGVAGFGWNISGLSAISRSPKTHYYDASYSGVEISSNDRFSLDGQRLICTSGTYGANGSVYRTANDIFSKVTCYTGSYGPDKFEVKTKDGLTYQYGYDNDADQTVSGLNETVNWYVNRITDVYGNYIDFSYIKDEGFNYIGEISYGPNKVTFYYKQRIDTTFLYLNGNQVVQKLLLDKIEIKYNSGIIKKYEFKYNYSGIYYNQHSVLNEIVEYGIGTDRYNSTAFDYQTPDIVSFSCTQNNTTHSYVTYKSDLYPGDFNGDGKTDFLCLPNANATWTGYKMYYGDGNDNFNYAYQSTSFSFGTLEDLRIIDLNSDGKDDIVYESVSSGTSTFKYIINTGSAFSSSTSICSQTNNSETGISGKYRRKSEKQENDNEISGTDYNGDGINDIFINDANGNWKIYSRGNSSGSLTSTMNLLASGTISSLTSQVLSGDFNGDGKADIWSIEYNGLKIYSFSGSALNQIYSNMAPSKYYFFNLGDFNGDGKIDMFLYGKSVNGTEYELKTGWELHISNGSTFNINTLSKLKDNLKDDYVRIGDFNGDGSSDIMATSSDDSWNGSYYYISRKNGTSLYAHNLSNYPTDKYRFSVADFDGDGRTDFLCTDAESSWWNGYQVYNSGSINNILLEKIADGLGALINISYQSIAEYGAPYTKGTGATFPVMDYQGPIQVVKSVLKDNGRGSQNTTNYSYQGLKIHRQGKGLLCMTKQTVTDVANNLITENNYGFDATKYFTKLTSTIIKAGSTTLSTENFNWEYKTPVTGVIFPYISTTTKSNSITGHSVTNTFSYNNTNGNLEQLSVNYNNGFTKTIVYGYDTNTTYKWIGGRLQSVNETYAKSGETSISRTTSYTYSTDGKLKPDYVKYLEGSNWYIYKNNDYNTQGNLTQIYEYSANGGTRQTNYTYQTNGVRVETLTDPLLHETEYAYDTYGRLSTEINYLNDTTAHYYDNMSRSTTESQSNGVSSSVSYNWGLSGGPAYAVYNIHKTGNDGSESIYWYDELGREIQNDVKGFDGSYIYTVTEYNTKGQVYRISEPSTSSSPSQWNTNSYDTNGRILGTTRPSGRNTTYSYSSNRVTNTTGGKTTWQETNSMGLVTTAHDNGGDIIYTYYPDGSVKTILTNGSTVSLEYDLTGNKKKLIDPGTGTIEYTWNAYGQLLTQKNARNQTTTYNYYADGRINTIQHPTGEGTDVYNYNSNKQLAGITNSTTNINSGYGYDIYGRIDSIAEYIAGTNFPTTFTYDEEGRLKTRTHPSEITETYSYNENGFLSGVSAELNHAVYTITNMNERMQITGANYGAYLIGEFGFDSYGFPKHSKARVGSTYRQDYRYAFNAVTGNLTTRKDSIPGEIKTETFTYDNLDRLLTVSGPQNLTLEYANNGNILTKNDLVPGEYAYTHATNPYAVTEINSSNLLIPSVDQTITYTSFEQPSEITENPYQAIFKYNSSGQRAKMEVKQNGSAILTRWYAGSRYIKEIEGSTTTEYTWIGGDAYSAPILAVKQGTNKTFYYLLRDHLGTITHVTNTSGAVQNRYSFDAWGRRRSPSSWTYTLPSQTDLLPDRGFTGHEYLEQFKLYNMNGRLYDPLVARFLSPDNNIQNPMNSQHYNRYSYGFNNPLKYVDPSGELHYLTQASSSTPDYSTPRDYSNNVGKSDNLNSFDIVGGGGSPGDAYKYSWSSGYYYDSNGNIITFDEVFNYKILPNAERDVEVAFEIYLGRGSWIDNHTALISNPFGNIAVFALFNFTGSYSVKTSITNGNGSATNSGDGRKDYINYTGETIGGVGLATKGRELLEWEYLSQARINRAIAGDFSQTIEHSLPTIRTTGRVLGYAGVAISGVDMAVNGVNVSNSLDLIMGGVAFVPGFGWALSGLYFVGNLGWQAYSGKTIGESIQSNFTDPNASWKPW